MSVYVLFGSGGLARILGRYQELCEDTLGRLDDHIWSPAPKNVVIMGLDRGMSQGIRLFSPSISDYRTYFMT